MGAGCGRCRQHGQNPSSVLTTRPPPRRFPICTSHHYRTQKGGYYEALYLLLMIIMELCLITDVFLRTVFLISILLRCLMARKLWLSLYSKQLLVIMRILRLIRSLVLPERMISVLLRTLRLFLMRILWMRFICISGTGSILLM